MEFFLAKLQEFSALIVTITRSRNVLGANELTYLWQSVFYSLKSFIRLPPDLHPLHLDGFKKF
jgi:hypothetical protein